MLEGGSLRGLFTAAVLDVFLEQDLIFSYLNGVSAGTMNAMNYMSRQPGRSLKIDLEYLHDKRFMSMENLLRNRQIFSFDFLFGELSQSLVPFDYETFEASPQIFEAVATRCKTGKPEYFRKGECSDIITAVQASSSMPVLSRMITLDGKKYLDGGLSMSIAYQRAIDLGYDKVVLILTRQKGYRKKPISSLTRKVYQRYFEPLPNLLEAILSVPERYNRMQEEIDQLEEQGRIFVIRPENPVKVSRLERDKSKLVDLYRQGSAVANSKITALNNYLERPNAGP